MDTLQKIASAIGDDPNFFTSINNRLAAKQDLIEDGDLSIAKTNGLQIAINAKQNLILDGDLTIAKTNGLQGALDAKAAAADVYNKSFLYTKTETDNSINNKLDISLFNTQTAL